MTYLTAALDDELLESELLALRRSILRTRRVGGWVDTVVEWSAAGIVGNFAFWLLRRAIAALNSGTDDGQRPISEDEVVAFLELYLESRAELPDDLLLVQREWKRASISGEVAGGTTWEFVLVGPIVEYEVTLFAAEGDSIPRLVRFGQRVSPRDRYDKLLETGRADPLDV